MNLTFARQSPSEQTLDPVRRPLLWQKVLLVIAFAWALIVVVPDFYRLYWPLGSLGFSADNDGIIYAVDGPPADAVDFPGQPHRGLKESDTIPLKPGACLNPASERCSNMLAVFGGMGGLAYVNDGTTVTLPIVTKDGQAANIRMTAKTQPLDSITRFFLALDEIAAVFVLWRAFKLVWDQFSRMTLGLFLYVMWFNPGQYFAYYAWLQRHPVGLLTQESLQALAQGAGYAGFLVFALRFPHDRTEPEFKGIERLVIAIGITLIVLQLLSFTNVFGIPTEVATRCAILSGYAVAFFAFYIVWRRSSLQSPMDYQRMLWVLWGCAIGLPCFIFADSNEATSIWDRNVWNVSFLSAWSPHEWVFEACYFVSGAFAILICEAVRRRRIVNISFELRRLAGAGLVLLPFAIAETWMHVPMTQLFMKSGLPGTMEFPTLVVAAVGCGAACHRSSHFGDHLLNRQLYHEIAHLEDLGAKAKCAAVTEDVDAILLNGPSDVLNLASAAVYRDAGGIFQRVCSRSLDDGDKPDLQSPADQILLKDLAKGHAKRLAWTSRTSNGGTTALTVPTLAVPVIFGGKLQAVAFYGPHETGDDIDRLEIGGLEKFASEAAAGYEFARLAALERELHALRRQLAGNIPNL